MTAVRHAREHVPLKSDNKDYGEDESNIPEKKLAQYAEDSRDNRTILLNKIQCRIYEREAEWKQNGVPPDFKELAALIRSRGANAAGNCYEQAILAYDHLQQEMKGRSVALDIVSLQAPGNHNFVAINQPKDPHGRYPADFSAWNEHAYIVDPWSKIACPARLYPEQWEEKMRKWDARGLKVNEESPLNEAWLRSIKIHQKISRLNAFPAAG